MLTQPPTLELVYQPLPNANGITVGDKFAGGGGSMSGIAQIPGIVPVYAANHWDVAIEIHNANFPDVDHACVDLHQERPAYFPAVDILWASPECTKWSQANGTELPDIEEGLFADPNADDAATQSRLLMFDVLRYAEHHRYRVMVVENVVDIATQPKYRTAWSEWRRRLTALGYRHRVVSLNAMHAQTYGPPAPQSRDRIYIVCWRSDHRAPDVDKILRPRALCPSCDELIEAEQAWKATKAGAERVGRYRQTYVYVHAACGSVVEPGWLPAADAIDWSLPGRRIGDRPLKDWYDKRGNYLGRGWLAPKTETRVVAGIARYWGPLHVEAAGNTYDAADPKHPAHGDPNGYYRAWPIDEPLRTLHTTGSKALVTRHYGIRGGDPARHTTTEADALRTLTGNGGNMSLLQRQPFVAELRGGSSDARSVAEPASTFTAGGNHHALVAPYYGNSASALPVDEPIGTLTTVDRYALVHRNNSGGAEMTTPVDEPFRTFITRPNQSLIQAGTPSGRPKVTPADLAAARELLEGCRLRMFEPHEVAAGMAFSPTYIWQPPRRKKPVTKRQVVRAAGNAVCPPCSRDVMAVCVESFLGGATKGGRTR